LEIILRAGVRVPGAIRRQIAQGRTGAEDFPLLLHIDDIRVVQKPQFLNNFRLKTAKKRGFH
jgi:hypothetical protein